MDINEGSTFVFTMDLWENDDGTIPVDLTKWTFDGAMDIGDKCIPLTITYLANGITVMVDSALMVDLGNAGSYNVKWTHIATGERFRLIEGKLTVNQEVVSCV